MSWGYFWVAIGSLGGASLLAIGMRKLQVKIENYKKEKLDKIISRFHEEYKKVEESDPLGLYPASQIKKEESFISLIKRYEKRLRSLNPLHLRWKKYDAFLSFLKEMEKKHEKNYRELVKIAERLEKILCN